MSDVVGIMWSRLIELWSFRQRTVLTHTTQATNITTTKWSEKADIQQKGKVLLIQARFVTNSASQSPKWIGSQLVWANYTAASIACVSELKSWRIYRFTRLINAICKLQLLIKISTIVSQTYWSAKITRNINI